MAAKLLSLYLLAVASLGVVRAVPLILDQRQDNPKGLSNGPVFNVTDFPLNVTHVAVKRAAPLILDQRQDNPNGTVAQRPSNVTSVSTTATTATTATDTSGPTTATTATTATTVTTATTATATNVPVNRRGLERSKRADAST